jgi:transposase
MEAMEGVCRKHHADLKAASDITHPKPLPPAETRKRRYSALPANRPGPTKPEQRAIDRRARRLARYELVATLRAQGLCKRRIAEIVGLDRRTVATWLAVGHFPERAQKRRRPHHLDRYADYITERYDAGLDNGTALARELRARGYRGNDAMVRRYLADLRRMRPRPVAGPHDEGGPPHGELDRAGTPEPREETRGETQYAGRPGASPAPSPRETAWLLRKADARPESLRVEERDYVDALCAASPRLDRVRSLATEFARLLREHDSRALDPWLVAAEQSELRAFAAGLRRDRDAVLAAVLFQWSNGQVEGQVQRLKLIKRTMYGRASFELLRRRVVSAA